MIDQLTVQLTDALAQMRQTDERGRPVPFSLEVTTCNEQADTGGENMVLTNWVLLHQRAPARPTEAQHVRRPTTAKPQNELADQMRRVKNPLNDEVRQISIRLITVFNGLEVIW